VATAGVIPVLALDLATNVGWALRDGAGARTSGVQRFAPGRGESPGMRWLRLRKWLREVIALGGLTPTRGVIAYEQAVFHHRGASAAAVAHGMAAVAQEVAAELAIELACVTPAELKKFATGKGNAKKDAMLAAARERWPSKAIADDNEADALWVLEWALQELGLGAATCTPAS
jgi:Holliday junction resolvasome RuvABC endonuclease subunit